MLVLAIDTATEVVTVGLVTVTDGDQPATVLAEQVRPGARQHGEQLMPAALEVCATAGFRLASVDAVVCGAGPGPFTGLRVGLVSAASLGDALSVPVYGVCSLDAVAAAVPAGEPLLVVNDARRREVYWATYQIRHGAPAQRIEGPAVDAPAVLADRVTELGVRRVAGPVAGVHTELLGLPEYPAPGVPEDGGLTPATEGCTSGGLTPAAGGPRTSGGLVPSAAGLVAAAGDDLRTRRPPAPLEPYYLRRPDAVPPGARKRVTLV